MLLEYLTFCIDWERVIVPDSVQKETSGNEGDVNVEEASKSLKDAITLLVAGILKSKDNRSLKEEIDADRAGIVMFRIP